MIKKNLIKVFIFLFFLSGCGYSTVFKSKDYNFSVNQLATTGDVNLNRIISQKLSIYKDTSSNKQLTLTINTSLQKEVSSKDTKGNPKTYRLIVKSNILIKSLEGQEKNKLFLRSVDYNNKNNKFDLKKFENEISKSLAGKIADELITYLQSI